MNSDSNPTCCPMCHRHFEAEAMRPLYRGKVCHVCRFMFACRRVGAYCVDFLLAMCAVSVCEVFIEMYFGISNFDHTLTEWIGMFLRVWLFMLILNAGAYFLFLPYLLQAFSGTYFVVWLLCVVVGRWVILPLLMAARDGWHGRSIGKRLFGLQTIDTQTGLPIGWRQSIKRNVLLMLPFSCWVIGFGLLKGQRAGDRAACTRVIVMRLRASEIFHDSDYCQQCQYDLTGNTTGVCPECGNVLTRTPTASPMTIPSDSKNPASVHASE